MKKLKCFYFLYAAALLLAVSCNKKLKTSDSQRISIMVSDNSMETSVTTKAEIPSRLYWAATIGSMDNLAWHSIIEHTSLANVENGVIATNLVQSSEPQTYNYFVSNNSTLDVHNSITGALITKIEAIGGNNGDDVVFGMSSSNSTRPLIELKHIFSRVGTVTFRNLPNGVSIANYTIFVKSRGQNTGISGTYDFRSDTWSQTTALDVFTEVMSGEMYLIPGYYDVRINFVDSSGKQYSQVTENIYFQAGIIKNFNAAPYFPR